MFGIPSHDFLDTQTLETFIHMLSVKAAQIISKTNNAIVDQQNVETDVKTALLFNQTVSIVTRFPFCIELSLCKEEGNEIALEIWTLSMQANIIEPRMEGASVVRGHMKNLLESLSTIRRITPAYKRFRQSDGDSFVIKYKTYNGEPQISQLTDDVRQETVGVVSTRLGKFTMAVAYRANPPVEYIECEDSAMLDDSKDHNKIRNKTEVSKLGAPSRKEDSLGESSTTPTRSLESSRQTKQQNKEEEAEEEEEEFQFVMEL